MARPHYIIAIFLCGATLLIARRGYAQSFNCKDAVSVVDKAICKDKSLEVMDSKLARAFREALARDADRRADLVISERRWLSLRADQCGAFFQDSGKINQCLGNLYGKRISDIQTGQFSITAAPNKGIAGSCDNLYEYGLPIETAALPQAVGQFVPTGEVAIDLVCADLTGDGQPGYLLVTYIEGDLSFRRLQLLLTMPDGAVTVIANNTNVVQPKGWDGSAGSYKIIGRREGFEVVDALVGSGGGDTYTFDFRYSPNDGTWLLIRAQKALSGDAHTDNDQAFVQRPKDFGLITIETFNVRPFAKQ